VIRRSGDGVLAAVCALMVAVTIAGCNGDDDPTPSASTASPSAVSASPTAEPSVATAQQQATAAYNGYIQSWASASQSADPDDPNLARYIADPLLSRTRHNLRKLTEVHDSGSGICRW
jgi:hypothetical protein